jgi:hypothetical protein
MNEATPPGETVPLSEKQRAWDERTEHFQTITDALGKGIDEGIMPTIVALDLLGIETRQSCEGHLDHGIAAPWVDILIGTSDDINVLQEKLTSRFKTIEQIEESDMDDDRLESLYNECRKIENEIAAFRLRKMRPAYDLLLAFYASKAQPDHDVALILDNNGRLQSMGALYQPILDENEREQKLMRYREEMSAFTAFLKSRVMGQPALQT